MARCGNRAHSDVEALTDMVDLLDEGSQLMSVRTEPQWPTPFVSQGDGELSRVASTEEVVTASHHRSTAVDVPPRGRALNASQRSVRFKGGVGACHVGTMRAVGLDVKAARKTRKTRKRAPRRRGPRGKSFAPQNWGAVRKVDEACAWQEA